MNDNEFEYEMEWQEYASDWRVLLRNFLEWPNDQAEQWIERRRESLFGSRFLSHEISSFEVVEVIVDYNQRMGRDLTSGQMRSWMIRELDRALGEFLDEQDISVFRDLRKNFVESCRILLPTGIA